MRSSPTLKGQPEFGKKLNETTCISTGKSRIFDVGDWLFLRLQPYKKISLKQAKKDNKLSPKYYGSYKVLENIGTIA